MTLDLSSIFNVFNLPSGRRLTAMREVLPIARELEFDKLVNHLEKAITREKELFALEKQWRAVRAGTVKDPTISLEMLQEARMNAQNELLCAVAVIFEKYMDDKPESIQARTRLLRPIMEQHEVIHAYLSARRNVRDIDPDTGEITDEVDLDQPEHIEIDPQPALA